MSTLIGVVGGVVLIVGAVALGGGYKIFLNLEAVMIVLGGTLAATLISFPLHRVFSIFTLTMHLFREPGKGQIENTMVRLMALGHKAYQDSVFALEKDAKAEKDRYLRLGLTMLVRDASAPRIARRFAMEMDGVKTRHKYGIQLFSFMAKIAPSFGLVGTLIGLINMLRGVGAEVSPETLGPAMAVALVTTLYGAVLAFLLFMPASEKLKSYSQQELSMIQMIRDAVLMIKDGESARDLQEMLASYLPEKRRRALAKRGLKKQG